MYKGLILQQFTRYERGFPHVFITGKLTNSKTFLIKQKYFPFFFIDLSEQDKVIKGISKINAVSIKFLEKHKSEIKKVFDKLNEQLNENLSEKDSYIRAAKKNLTKLLKDNEVYFINELPFNNHNKINNEDIKKIKTKVTESKYKIVSDFFEQYKIDLIKDDWQSLICDSLQCFDFFFEKSKLISFNKESVVKIVYLDQSSLDIFAKLYPEVFRNESDISLPVKYLTENKIKGQIAIDAEPEGKTVSKQITNEFNYHELAEGQKIDCYFLAPKIDSCEEELKVKTKTCAIDIETLRSGEIISISFYSKKEQIVIFNHKKPKYKKQNFEIIETNSEKALLQEFVNVLHKVNPDIITGWAVIDFDIQMIHKRMERHKIPFNLGRIPLNCKLSIQDNFLRSSTCTIPGRVVLDGIAILKDNFVKFDDYKLGTVAREMLGEDKTASGAEVEDLYHEDHDELLIYNLVDSKLVYDIVVENGYVDISIARSRITGMTMDRLDKSIATLDYLYLLMARERGICLPDNVGFSKERPIEGGYVRDPITGIYDNILVFDFKSLYPSIMITLNIDKFSYLGNIEKVHDYGRFDKDRFFDSSKKEEVVISPTGAIFEKKEAIIPELLTKLWAERDIAKKEKNEVKSYAIKITMNSVYGSLASPYCRLFSTDIAGSITAFARVLIKKAAEMLQEKGYEVIYGDTDSLFVNPKMNDQEKLIKFGNEVVEDINKFIFALFKKKFGFESRVELEFEKIYKKFIMPQVRGRAGGAKKRYAGLKINLANGKEKVDVVGLEAVRRDWVVAAREFQLKMLDILFHNDNPQDKMTAFTKKTIDDIKAGKLDEKLVYKKGLRKDVSSYTKTTPPHVKAARMLDRIDSDVITYYITEDGPQPIQKLKSKIDYEHYINKQIKPIAESIFVFFDMKFEDILKGSSQKNLFSFG